MRLIDETRVDDLDIDNLVPWARAARVAAFGWARLRFLQASVRRWLTPIIRRRLSTLSDDPVRSVRAVGEARRSDTLAGLYASGLQRCIRGASWGCWPGVFRLDGFATEREREEAVRA